MSEILQEDFPGTEKQLREKLGEAFSSVMNANQKLKFILQYTNGITKEELIRISDHLDDLATDTWNTFQDGETIPASDLRYGKTIRF